MNNSSLLNQSVQYAASAAPANGKQMCITLLELAGLSLIPHLPEFINRFIDIPEKMMANGYECDIKAGNTEFKFGKNLFNHD